MKRHVVESTLRVHGELVQFRIDMPAGGKADADFDAVSASKAPDVIHFRDFTYDDPSLDPVPPKTIDPHLGG